MTETFDYSNEEKNLIINIHNTNTEKNITINIHHIHHTENGEEIQTTQEINKNDILPTIELTTSRTIPTPEITEIHSPEITEMIVQPKKIKHRELKEIQKENNNTNEIIDIDHVENMYDIIDTEITMKEIEIKELKKQIEELKKEKEKIEERSRNNFISEFSLFSTNFPMCGEQFESGFIDSINGISTYIINFAKTFKGDPIVFIYKASASQRGEQIIDCFITKTNQSFTMKLNEPPEKGDLFLWFAYAPQKMSRKEFGEICKIFQSNMSINQIESHITNYVKKHGTNDYDKDGKTLLHYCVQHNYVEIAEWLISKGANVNAVDKFRYTPLHMALANQDINSKMVNMLLDNGADKRSRNYQHRTPLHYLCRNSSLAKYMPLFYRLIPSNESNKEYINVVSTNGETAFLVVCSASLNLEALEYLANHQAEINVQSKTENHPFYYAIKTKNLEAFRLLLKLGVSKEFTYHQKTIETLMKENKIENEMNDICKSLFISNKLYPYHIERIRQYYSSITYPNEEWILTVDDSEDSLINTQTLPIGFHVDNSKNCCTSSYPIYGWYNAIDYQINTHYYLANFEMNKHNNYVLQVNNGIIIMSVQDMGMKNGSFYQSNGNDSSFVFSIELLEHLKMQQYQSNQRKKVYVRTKKGMIRKEYHPTVSDLQIAKEFGFTGKSITPIQSKKMYQTLVRFEQQNVQNECKFSVLYAKPGQTTEIEMFQNQEGSNHFIHFLELLGKKINGNDYTGGLNDQKVERAPVDFDIITSKFNNEIDCVFHISTFLPFNLENTLQPERKRILHNNPVSIIFKEYNGTIEQIDISSFKSYTNNVFIVIGYDITQKDTDVPLYDLNVCVKNDIPPIPPFIYWKKYRHEQAFSEFLLAKLLNADRLAKKSPYLRGKQMTFLQNQIESIGSNALN